MEAELQKLRIDKSQKASREERALWPWILIVLVAVALGAGVWQWRTASAAQVVQTIRVRAPEPTSNSNEPDTVLLNATGYIIAAHKIELASKVVGRVAWVGVEMGDKIQKDQVLVRLEDDEYQAQCAGPKPEPQTRTVHQEESGCDVGGVHSWDEVYTTPFVWDHVTKTWVLGEETGPVVENDTLTPYTAQELEDLGCVEVEGEQGHKPPKHHPNTPSTPEVKGEQATVPTEVEAGLAGTPADRVPAGGGSNLPLWLLSLGAGLFLTGAGRLRRRGEAGR